MRNAPTPDAALRERYRRFREQCAAAADADSVRERARQWRDVSFEERARVGIGLMGMADMILRSRPEPYEKPPLTLSLAAIARRRG
jgi:hypothetical protein